MPMPDRRQDLTPPLSARVAHRARLLRVALTRTQAPGPVPGWFARDAAPGRFAVESDAASRELAGRLEPGEVEALRARIAADPDLGSILAGAAEESVARHLLLSFGTWLEDPVLAARTGLVKAVAPERVHAMAHGPLAAAGGIYEADMIANALASACVDIATLRTALDFGCSSGRVLRVLAAAFPAIRWIGCDPNRDAVAWGHATFPAPAWFVSPNEPPLPLADATLDLVYAISIWSHFAPALGLRWFEEMHRVIEPGGHLVFTTHGLTALAYDAAGGRRPMAECAEIQRALYAEGSWFIDPFGEAGDWGVVNPQWGSAFLTPEWVLGQLCPSWSVVEFVAGRNQGNQDVYVLARA